MTGKYWGRPWSLVDGCTPCSPGCEHCWSMAMAKRFKKWPDRDTIRPDRLDIPLKTRKPTVFSVWNDLFHEHVPTSFIAAAFNEICRAHLRDHTFLILTKRAERMKNTMIDFFEKIDFATVFDCCWLGVTVCNQAEADEKIPILLQTPAAHRWISIEPCLSEIDIDPYTHEDEDIFGGLHIDAVILGGETGPGARPMHPDWVRSVRDQCKAAGVPFFFKQWGEYVWRETWGHSTGRRKHIFDDGVFVEKVGRKEAGRLLDGREHNELPWRTKDA